MDIIEFFKVFTGSPEEAAYIKIQSSTSTPSHYRTRSIYLHFYLSSFISFPLESIVLLQFDFQRLLGQIQLFPVSLAFSTSSSFYSAAVLPPTAVFLFFLPVFVSSSCAACLSSVTHTWMHFKLQRFFT